MRGPTPSCSAPTATSWRSPSGSAKAAAADEVRGWIGRAERASAASADPATGRRHSCDQAAGARVPAATHAGFLAFWAGLGDAALAASLERWIAGAAFAVPSVAADNPRFGRKRYWRGPAWAIANMLIAEGLREAGFADLARRIRADARRLIEGAGFFERFDPLDGAGLGGGRFTWTAAMWLAWARAGEAA